MVGQHDHSDDAKTGEPAVDRPALRIELQASEQVWVSVRNSLRLWASDSSLSTVSPEVAWPLKISIDDIDPPSGQCGVGTVRLNLGWAPLENAALAERAAEPIAETAVPASPAETPEQNPPQKFVFFADPPIVCWQPVPVPAEPTSDQAAIAHADQLRHALGHHRRPIVRATRKAGIRMLRLLSAWGLALHDAARTLAAHRWSPGGWMAWRRAVARVLPLQKRLLKIDLRRAWHDAGSRAEVGSVAAAVGGAVLIVAVATGVLGPAISNLPVRDALSPERHLPLSTGGAQAPGGAVVARPVATAQPVASRSLRDDVATAPERASTRGVGAPARRTPEMAGTIGTYSRVRSEALGPAGPLPAVAAFVREPVRTPVAQPAAPAFVGTLVVESEPEGAEVSINGVPHGRTPLMIPSLAAGSRVVRLDLPGYERWSRSVRVVANARTPVAVKLQPEIRAEHLPPEAYRWDMRRIDSGSLAPRAANLSSGPFCTATDTRESSLADREVYFSQLSNSLIH